MTTRKILTAVSIVIVSMLLTASGCNGSKGDTGATGATGPAGTAGTLGTTGTTPTNTVLNPYENLPGVVIAVTGVSGGTGTNGNFKVGDTIKVTFTIKKNNGTYLPATELNDGRIFVSGPTTNYQRILERKKWYNATSPTLVLNADNTYTYTFTSAIPANYMAPLNDTAAFTDGELTGQALQDGTYTIGIYAYKNYTVNGVTYKDVANVTQDILLGNAAALDPREVVKIDNCNQCHITLQVHDGTRRQAKLCLLCHTAGSEDSEDPLVTPGITIEFKNMVHKIHNGAHLPSVLGVATNVDGTRNYAAAPTPYIIDHDGELQDYSEVGFPVWPNMSFAMPRDRGYSSLTSAQKTTEDTIRKGVTECSKCHGDPDGTGPLTAPAQGTKAYTNPSRRACGACHDDIDFTKPYQCNNQTMPAQANDNSCTLCHAGTGTNPGDALDVINAHRHPLNDSNFSAGAAFSVTTLTGGTGAGGAENFVAGDVPQVTFTVKDDNGADVALGSLDRALIALVGPTYNRQSVYLNNSFPTVMPFDFAGRLASSSTTNKGIMSKVVASTIAASETLTVEFTSATAYNVTGSVSAALGAGALPASPSTNPSGSSVTLVTLASTSNVENVTIAFTDATNFTVTGSVTGAMGSGTLPATTSTAMRFVSTDGKLAFTLTVGTTAFVAGNNVYLTVFKGGVANPVIFAIVAGRTSFAATDRIYYDVVKSAANYTFKMPVDIMPLELLGYGDGNVGQQLTAANLPVYYGRQTLYERTALVGAATTLAAASVAYARYVDVNDVTGLAALDYIVIQNGAGLGIEEYAQIGYIDTTGGLKRVWFKMPLRYAHAATAAFQEVTLTYLQEGATNQYTLNPTTGVVTSVVAWTLNNPVIMSYRSDMAFRWKRHPGDAFQSTYFPPPMDSPDFDETWGEWTGKTLADGTYTVGMWGSITGFKQLQNEYQTYTVTRVSSRRDFLFGGATTITPYSLFSSGANCNACHSRVMFHGAGYIEAETCVMCHGIAGTEDTAKYSNNNAASTPGVTVNYRTMLHKIHMGEELANAATYQVGSYLFDEVVFPAMPGKVKHCTKCHGDTNTAWKEPADRSHPTQQGAPARVWRAVCNSCHDGTEPTAHINLMTAANGVESCEVCHGPGMEFQVEQVHRNR